jgi:hypothetical protein
MARNYPESLVDRATEKAKKIPRKIALLKIRKKKKIAQYLQYSITPDSQQFSKL